LHCRLRVATGGGIALRPILRRTRADAPVPDSTGTQRMRCGERPARRTADAPDTRAPLHPASHRLRLPPVFSVRNPAMPTFDIVSEVDKHELTNALDQAQRELGTRFDFRNVDAKFVLDGFVVSMNAPSEFQLKQMRDILDARLIARGIDVRSLDPGDVETNLAGARQKVTVKQGIEQKVAKKIIAAIKEAKLKVEAQINGEKLRISAKKRDDLQVTIALLRKGEFELPLQFENFRD
jgi:uncharacterized protein YajQ (UPF0234 family)